MWERYTTTRDEVSREGLVLAYLGLVKYVAGRLAMGLPTFVEVDDLFGAGLLGLMQALDKFDVERNIKFETYAIPRIRGAMLDELRTQDWFPRSIRRKARQLESAYAEVEAKIERAASDEEIAAHMKIEMADYHALVDEVSLTTLVSLDKEVASSNEGLYAVLSDTLRNNGGSDPAELLEEKELRRLIRETINDLPDKERTVLNLYYYEELTLKEIGDILGISESRVCQIHTKSVLRLRGRVLQRTKIVTLTRLTAEIRTARERKGDPALPVPEPVSTEPVTTGWAPPRR